MMNDDEDTILFYLLFLIAIAIITRTVFSGALLGLAGTNLDCVV